ncbi:hypothetical protein ACIBI4_18000 [Streptomyces sp. NPDC050418]|uniref:hypothetical protein n=1 Tax=Streptomyces sp. NPDC050418 TaxID=3365612 RepID=UPI0037A6A93D
MRVVLMAPFLLGFRMNSRTFQGTVGERLADAVAQAVPEFQPGTGGPDSEMLFDHHMSTGGSRFGGRRVSGTVEVPGAGRARVRFDPSGTGFFMQEVDVPDRDTMHARERALVVAAAPLVRSWNERITAAMLSGPNSAVGAAGGPVMEIGRLLWWHRILVDPPEGQEPAATRCYGVERRIHDTAILRFGDGFTVLKGLPEHRLGEVLGGLMAAQQEWIAMDEANRLVSERLLNVRESRWEHLSEIDEQFTTALALSKDLALRDLVRLEESRYVVNAAGVVFEAAMERWAMNKEQAALEVQTQSLRDMLEFHRTMAQSRRDERRNQMLFVFTVVALLQSVLAWYDFVHEENNTLAPVLRIVLAAVVASLTLLVAGTSMFRRLRR